MCYLPALTGWVIYAPAPSEMTGCQSLTGSFLMLMKLLHLETKRDLARFCKILVITAQGFSSYGLFGGMWELDCPLWFPVYWPAETNCICISLLLKQLLHFIISKKTKKRSRMLQNFDHYPNTEQLMLRLRVICLMDGRYFAISGWSFRCCFFLSFLPIFLLVTPSHTAAV